MRLNPYRCELRDSELFTAAEKKFLAKFPLAGPLLEDLADQLKKRPEIAGEPAEGFTGPAYDGRDMRLQVYARTRFFPAIRVVYEIAPGVVTRWNMGERD